MLLLDTAYVMRWYCLRKIFAGPILTVYVTMKKLISRLVLHVCRNASLMCITGQAGRDGPSSNRRSVSYHQAIKMVLHCPSPHLSIDIIHQKALLPAMPLHIGKVPLRHRPGQTPAPLVSAICGRKRAFRRIAFPRRNPTALLHRQCPEP